MTGAQIEPGSSSKGGLARLWERHRLPTVLVIGAAVLAVAVVVLNLVGILDIPSWWITVGDWWHGDGWPWLSAWLLSPGFGGAAAVLAASLAFIGTRHQARLNAWWQRVEWALNLYVKPDATGPEREAGVAALEALQKSALAKKDEKAFLGEVVTAVTLDLDSDGDADDDLSRASGQNSGQSVVNGKKHNTLAGLWTKFRRMLDTRRES